jgi:hypothetical protein
MSSQENKSAPLDDLSPRERAIYDAITRLNSWLREFGTTVQPQFAKDLRVVTDAALDYLISQREAKDIADTAEKVKELGEQISESLAVSIAESVNSSAREYVAPTVAGIVTSMMEEMLMNDQFIGRLSSRLLGFPADMKLPELAFSTALATDLPSPLAEAASDYKSDEITSTLPQEASDVM